MLAGARFAAIGAIGVLAPLAQADTAMILATVGQSSVSVEQARHQLRRTPKETLARLAPKKQGIIERFVDQFLVTPALREEAARQRALTDEAFREQLQPKLDYALQRAVEHELADASVPTQEQIEAFYERHRRRYEQPEAIRIWRILLKDPEVAKKIISEVEGKPDGAARFRALAREHSLDTATKMRSGDLGFVRPDGHTDVPQVRVQKSLVAAAAQLKDGELAPVPAVEGDYLAVYWRRGTRSAVNRPLAEEAENISAILRRDQARSRLGDLVGALRKEHLVEGDLTLLESIKYPKPSVTPVLRDPPKQHASTGSPVPNK